MEIFLGGESLNPDLKKLLDIQGFDKQIAEFELELKRIKQKEDRIIGVVETKFAQISEVKEELEELNKDLKFKEELLAETLDNLKKLEVKLNSISTEKQLQAVNTEIDIARTNKTVLEDKIESLKEQIANKERGLKELEDRYDQLKKTLRDYQERFAKRREEIKNKIEEIIQTKEELIPTIEKKIFRKYEKINKWAKGTAIVPVVKDACYGCFMKLTPQVLTLLQDTDEIVYCPNCGRMLYLEETEEQ